MTLPKCDIITRELIFLAFSTAGFSPFRTTCQHTSQHYFLRQHAAPIAKVSSFCRGRFGRVRCHLRHLLRAQHAQTLLYILERIDARIAHAAYLYRLGRFTSRHQAAVSLRCRRHTACRQRSLIYAWPICRRCRPHDSSAARRAASLAHASALISIYISLLCAEPPRRHHH